MRGIKSFAMVLAVSEYHWARLVTERADSYIGHLKGG
jgi:hypothetical protein